MYVRIARFEGLDSARIDEQVAEMQRDLQAARARDVPADAPDEVRVLMETVARFVHLLDRDGARALGLTFCRTEDDLRRANDALNAMSPPEGAGERTDVELYEVAIDESFG